MTAPLPNWKSPAGLCLTIRNYSGPEVGSCGVRDAGKRPQEIWSTPSSSTRATFTGCWTLPEYYGSLRRYAEEEAVLDRVMVLEPDNVDAKLVRASMEADSKANLIPADQIIDSIRATNPAGLSSIADYWLWVALVERNVAAAENALTASGANPISLTDVVRFNRPFLEGVIAVRQRMMPKRALLLPLRGSSKRKSFKLNQITLQRCACLV